jgi:hypothetical protein
MNKEVKKILKQIEVLSVQSFNKNYPSCISNGLTTVELKLKETLREIEKVEKYES